MESPCELACLRALPLPRDGFFQEQQELSFLAFFFAIYFPIAVNRSHVYRKLEAHAEVEKAKRERDFKVLRQNHTTHLDTTTQAVRLWGKREFQKISAEAIQTKKQLESSYYSTTNAVVFLHEVIRQEMNLDISLGYAASPEFLVALYSTIRQASPSNIVELGSGLSSIVMGYALKANG